MNLIFDQHYYTASFHKAGFHTIDSSNNLSIQEISELENLGYYKPPFGLKDKPSNEEIESGFPINISFYRLKSGRFVYLHSKFTGRENHVPSRYGNFFTHSLILPNDQDPDFAATCILGSKQKFPFKQSLPIEEDKTYVQHLKTISVGIENSVPEIKESFNEFCLFLNKADKIFIFQQIIDLIVTGWYSHKGTNITICDTKDNLGNWVLAINYLLPQNISNQISFASYVYHPNDVPFRLTGVMPENEIGKLDTKYFKLIDARNSFSNYKCLTSFSSYLSDVIQNKDFSSWQNANEKAKQLNIQRFEELNFITEALKIKKGKPEDSSIEKDKFERGHRSFEILNESQLNQSQNQNNKDERDGLNQRNVADKFENNSIIDDKLQENH